MGGGSSKYNGMQKELEAQQVVLQAVPKELDTWTNLPPFPKSSSGSDAESNYRLWDFNIWLLDPSEYTALSMSLLQDLKLPEAFNLVSSTWVQFIMQVRSLMGKSQNPYHNFTHIMDVTHGCYCLLSMFGGAEMFKDIDKFAILTSAVVHDLEHTGTNNLYHVNAGTALAIRYNDISVLENHHCAKAFELFGVPECNILAPFSADQRKYLRKTMIALILATDMSVHFTLKADLDRIISNKEAAISNNAEPMKEDRPAAGAASSTNGKAAELSDAESLTVMKCILHCADISNPGKSWEISRKWSDLVMAEFFAQGDREKAENLPISMNCDRDTTVQDELSMNFTDFIVAPFFFSMTRMFPKMLPICKELENNRNQWNSLMAERVRASNETSKVPEVLQKWEARKNTFIEKMTDLTQACAQIRDAAPA